MGVSSTNYITILNGTLDGFAYGIEISSVTPGRIAHLLIDNITFKNDLPPPSTLSIHLVLADGAVVNGCNFVGAMCVGVFDQRNERAHLH